MVGKAPFFPDVLALKPRNAPTQLSGGGGRSSGEWDLQACREGAPHQSSAESPLPLRPSPGAPSATPAGTPPRAGREQALAPSERAGGAPSLRACLSHDSGKHTPCSP